MEKEFDVFTGEVKTGTNNVLLRSNAIGSCVVVVAFDQTKKIGGLAHVMLPGKAPLKVGVQEMKYAQNAITQLLIEMTDLGVKPRDLGICLVGGANVLKRENDTIAKANVESVLEIIANHGLEIIASSLGGCLRRTVSFNVENGQIRYSIGDSLKQLLFKVGVRSNY